MAKRSVPPSNLSPLGLVRHLTDVERPWFRRVMAGEDVPSLYPDGSAFDGAVGSPAAVELAWANWRAEVSFAEQLWRHLPCSFGGLRSRGAVLVWSVGRVTKDHVAERTTGAGPPPLSILVDLGTARSSNIDRTCGQPRGQPHFRSSGLGDPPNFHSIRS
jgi:hypothetical protein